MTTLLKVKKGTPRHMDETDNRSFEAWMTAIDGILTRYRGLSAYDLPDCCYHDWYDARVRPVHAANRALRYATEDSL